MSGHIYHLAPVSQGKQANKSGRSAEEAIVAILRQKHYQVTRQVYMGLGIYGTQVFADIFVSPLARYPGGLVIESKWQEKAGSVDEKYPYLVQNILHCYSVPAVVVCGGGGAKAGALRWLRAQVDGHKLVAVFSLEEFLTWTIRNL